MAARLCASKLHISKIYQYEIADDEFIGTSAGWSTIIRTEFNKQKMT